MEMLASFLFARERKYFNVDSCVCKTGRGIYPLLNKIQVWPWTYVEIEIAREQEYIEFALYI